MTKNVALTLWLLRTFKTLGVLARTGPSSKVSLTILAGRCEVDPSCCACAGPPCRSTTAITPSTSAKLTVASNGSGDLPCLLTLLLEGVRCTLVGAFMLTISLRPREGVCTGLLWARRLRKGVISPRLVLRPSEHQPGHSTLSRGGAHSRMGYFSGYSPECVEGGFSEVRRLVLRRSRLGTLFEGAVHLLKPLLRVGLKAPGEQGDEQTLERFSLEESNTVLLQRLDGEGVLTIEHTRHQ